MTNSNEFSVEGTIKEIRFDFTSKGKRYARVLVEGPLNRIWVTVFTTSQVKKLMSSKPGDKAKATGTGYHTGGAYHKKGSTSLTARLFRVTTSKEGRIKAAAPKPQQLSLI